MGGRQRTSEAMEKDPQFAFPTEKTNPLPKPNPVNRQKHSGKYSNPIL